MSTLGELSAILAHEIKNPLNSMIINVEVLRGAVQDLASNKEHPSAKKASKYLDVIEGEIRRLDKVIKGFLDFANPSPSTQVRIKLNLIIQKIIDFMGNELKLHQIEVDCELDPHLPSFSGSPDQIQQALLNLFLNSLQAMPRGGRLNVSTTHDSENNLIRVIIADSGSGIDSAIRAKIFNPYFTTKEKGSGLGLTIVRQVIERHGGQIHLLSGTATGTTFELTFPVSAHSEKA